MSGVHIHVVAGRTNPRRKEKPLLPQPDPSVNVVKTHSALCFSGVRTRRAMQIAIDAMTTVTLVKSSIVW